jgi:hypothetical protein
LPAHDLVAPRASFVRGYEALGRLEAVGQLEGSAAIFSGDLLRLRRPARVRTGDGQTCCPDPSPASTTVAVGPRHGALGKRTFLESANPGVVSGLLARAAVGICAPTLTLTYAPWSRGFVNDQCV